MNPSGSHTRPPPPSSVGGLYTSNSASSTPVGFSRQQASEPSQPSPSVQYQQQRPPIAAPRPMPPYQSVSLDPVISASGRSPSPTKRSFNFPIGMGDPSERWNSFGQATHLSSQRSNTAPRKLSIHGSITSTAEPFLGYNELFVPNGTHLLSTSDVSKGGSFSTSEHAFPSGSAAEMRSFEEQDPYASRGGAGPYAQSQDDYAFSISAGSGNPRFDDRPFPGSSASGMPLSAGSMSPRSLLHYQQMQAQQQAIAQQSGTGNLAGLPGATASEEITTVFIVGFPDDMTEREFANMFLFAKGFEASTLKVPVGLGQSGPSGRLDGGGPLSAGPGGPYQAVSMPGPYEMPNSNGGAWEDLTRAGASDTFSSLASGVNNLSAGAAGAKIKQIIGFAKFRTRIEALEARDALNGRKIDVEKGCILKTEMAKKNLHTKQKLPLPSGEGGGGFQSGPPGGPLSPLGHPAQLQQLGASGSFDPRTGPSSGISGAPYASFAKGPAPFDSFNKVGNSIPTELLSPQEMFGGGTEHPVPGIGPPGLRAPGSLSQQPMTFDRRGPQTGPIDYYIPDPIYTPTGGPSSSGPGLGSQNVGRSEWSTIGSPPGLAGLRPAVPQQSSRGTPSDFDPSVQIRPAGSDIGRTEPPSAVQSAKSPTSAGLDSSEIGGNHIALASRLGQLGLGSPSSDDGRGGGDHRAPSPDIASPVGRGVVGDNHPPVNTLFVGNLPSNASSAALSLLEDQMRSLFGSRRGYRQLSFRLKSNGPMCFVEFEDVHTAGKAMAELNGNTLNGVIKNGGIRLSFSKNPLFRMNSGNGGLHSGSGSLAGSGSGSGAGSGSVNSEGQKSSSMASESLGGTRR